MRIDAGYGSGMSYSAIASRPASRRSAKLIGRGPEGAVVHEEFTMRMAQNTSSTDIGWGFGGQDVWSCRLLPLTEVAGRSVFDEDRSDEHVWKYSDCRHFKAKDW